MKFCIPINGDRTEMHRVLSILFDNGYVFCVNRMRNANDIMANWASCNTDLWKYAGIGDDSDCKAKINIWNVTEEDMLRRGYTVTNVERLVSLNEGVIG